MARENAARQVLLQERKPVGDGCLTPPNARPIPMGYKLLAAAVVSLLLWAGIFWLGGYVVAQFS